MDRIETGDFSQPKVPMFYEDKYFGYYKVRPVLIIGKKGRYYECLPITSILRTRDVMRIDVFRQYNLSKHSQIICDRKILVDEKYFVRFLSKCLPEDYECIIERTKYETKKHQNFDY